MERVVSGPGWNLRLLDGWEHKREEHEELFIPPGGGPGITIATAKIDGEWTENDLRHLARDHTDDGHELQRVRLGDFNGLTFRYVEDDLCYRHWYVAAGRMWLHINYDCQLVHQGQHDSAIDKILRSLVVDVAAI